MTTELANRALQEPAALIEKVIVGGDLADLSPAERVTYYVQLCESLGLNWRTKPFEYLVLNGKLTLYARRDATDQLRNIHGVNISIVAREVVDDIYIVTARATTNSGRSDESIGAVPLVKPDGVWKTNQNGKRYFEQNDKTIPLTPDERANAMMKSETKSKRRVTLSVVGLGWLDETEIETIPSARTVTVTEHGEIIEPAKPSPKPKQSAPQPQTATPDPFAEARALLKQIYADAAFLSISTDQLDQAARKDDPKARDIQEASLDALRGIASRLAAKRLAKEAEVKPA